MKRTGTIIIGGGQAGLAMSRSLRDRGVDHVVLERGRVGERWRTERWDSLRLLTPNWQSRLPGWRYQGADPDGYMTMPEVIRYLEDYARSFDAPVESGTTVQKVERNGAGYRVDTDRGTWNAPNVVIATGYCDKPSVPGMTAAISSDITQLVPSRYRNPDQLPDGGVLVVGASASGIQLADEIHRSGRPVTLAVGRHIRLPRTYRGRDILAWLDAMGVFDETTDEVHSIEASRRQPSMQLVGRPDRRDLDLSTLYALGVRLTGRAVHADRNKMWFDDDLQETADAADAKLRKLLARIDGWIDGAELSDKVPEAESIPPVRLPGPPTMINLDAEGIRTVLWATGFRRTYPWLSVPVLDERGEVRHRGGITPADGLYVLGLQFLRRRKSTFIDGVGDDANDLAEHISQRLDRACRAVA